MSEENDYKSMVDEKDGIVEEVKKNGVQSNHRTK